MLFIFKNFLLGSHYVPYIDAQLDLKVCSFSYDGYKKGFTFQKFLNLHKFQHIIADGLMKYGYSGVYDNSKVRIRINGINTTALNACKSAILSIPDIQG